MTLPSKVIIVGAGPVGCYAAARLCQTRLVSEVHVYEKQEKIGPERTAGRNVNVTLCQRGLDALKTINVIPGSTELPAKHLTHFAIYTSKGKTLQPYQGNGLMSVKRNDLYQALHDTARSFGAQFHFGVQLESISNTIENNENKLSAMFVDKDGRCSSEMCSFLIGSDGVHSTVRKNMFDNVISSRYRDTDSLNEVTGKYPDSCIVLEHKLAYREITIPSGSGVEMDTFHIWGTSGLIVLGLPSADDTLTLGVYMDKSDLRQCGTEQLVQRITDAFPELKNLLVKVDPTKEEGHNLGSLHCVISPYFGKNSVVMLGDAGHAMLPFLGQGLNSGLEDVCLLLDCLDQEKGQADFIGNSIEKFSKLRIDDIHTIVHESFNECEKLQLLRQGSEPEGIVEDSVSQTKSFFELISTTNTGYKQALDMTSSKNKGIGAKVKQGETLAVHQAVKTVTRIVSPCDGLVTDITTGASGEPVYTVKPEQQNQSGEMHSGYSKQMPNLRQTQSDLFNIELFKSQVQTKAIGQQLTYMESTGSTMDDAKLAAQRGCPSGSVFMAETMTKGRGRQGKTWTAPPKGNIYITFVLRLTEKSSCLVQFAAALAVAKAIRSEGLEAKVKWPNDIWVKGHKVSGILVEAEMSAAVSSRDTNKEETKGIANGNSSQSNQPEPVTFYLGIGINVNDDTRRNPALRNMATSISSELFGQKITRERILANLCLELEFALDKSMAAILTELEPYLLLSRSSEVKVTPKDDEEFTAVVENIDNMGRLHVQRTDSDHEVVLSDLMTSVRPSPCHYIYVYEGDGSSKQSVHMLYESLLVMCDVSKYMVKKISPEDIKQGHWVNSAAILAIGGGFDTGYMRALGPNGLKMIKDYVHAGGRYLGICAGAYLACREIEFDRGGPLEVCGQRSLEFFPGSWTQYCYLLAIGGGFASGFIRALSDEGIQKIQDFVKSGGRYLGIGAGAYFGAQAVEFDKGGPQEKCRSDYLLNFYPGKCIGPTFPGFVYNSEAGARAAEIKWTSQASTTQQETSWTGYVYYNGGGHFEIDCPASENVETISELLNSPDGKIHTTAVKCKVGKGLAVLSGVHFEYLLEDLDETDQYLKEIMPKLGDTVSQRDRFCMTVMHMLGL